MGGGAPAARCWQPPTGQDRLLAAFPALRPCWPSLRRCWGRRQGWRSLPAWEGARERARAATAWAAGRRLTAGVGGGPFGAHQHVLAVARAAAGLAGSAGPQKVVAASAAAGTVAASAAAGPAPAKRAWRQCVPAAEEEMAAACWAATAAALAVFLSVALLSGPADRPAAPPLGGTRLCQPRSLVAAALLAPLSSPARLMGSLEAALPLSGAPGQRGGCDAEHAWG